jgi:Mn2+/Fe2+ NRAMP family transporter
MLLTYPLMVAIQEISARIGRTTGHGISGNLCRHYPNWLLQLIVTLLFIANTINTGADLSSMADAARVLFGGRSFLYVLAFATICVGGIVFLQYKLYVTFLKWLTLSLFAYVAAMFAAKVNWSDALSGVLLPRITWSNEYFTTLVAILGTTISPYLFFWQASQEAERVTDAHWLAAPDTVRQVLTLCHVEHNVFAEHGDNSRLGFPLLVVLHEQLFYEVHFCAARASANVTASFLRLPIGQKARRWPAAIAGQPQKDDVES